MSVTSTHPSLEDIATSTYSDPVSKNRAGSWRYVNRLLSGLYTSTIDCFSQFFYNFYYFANIYNSLAHYTRGTPYYDCSLLFYFLLFPYGTFYLILLYCLSSRIYYILTSWWYLKTTVLSLTVTHTAPVGYFQATQMFHSAWFLSFIFMIWLGFTPFYHLKVLALDP